MKKILIFSSLVALLIAGGCKKLDPQLYGTTTTTNFPATASDWTNYAILAYEPFQSKFGYSDGSYENCWFSPEYGYIMQFDYGTDEMNVYTGYGNFFTNFSQANYAFLINQGVQSDHFQKTRFITKMTQIASDLSKANIDASLKNTLTAEVRMARGWTMYYLLQLYGPVPTIIDPSKIGTDAEFDMTRPTRAVFLNYIINDLTFAAANLPKTPTDYGRFNQALALTILMKTYMAEKDFSNAEKTGRQIMAMGYALVNDYASLYNETTEKNSETMWAATCTPLQDGANTHAGFNVWDDYTYPVDYPGNAIKTSYANQVGAPFSATWQFYDSFDPADKRRALLIASYTNKTGGITNRASGLVGPVIAKYPDNDFPMNSTQGNDLPIARIADVMLMLAEAINQNSGPTAEAISLVNQVRLAHGGAAIGNVPASATIDKNSFDLWILKEQGWDLYFEGDRKMQLLRHGQYNQALTSVGKTPGNPLLPVSNYQLNAGKGTLTQTTGY